MKKFVFTLVLTTTSFYCHAIDGHNGIKFNMNQQQVEQLGFICNTSDNSDKSYLARCKHMEMTGTAFSVPTRNYEVTIGKDKQVSSIGADLIGVRSFTDYVELSIRISEFFPKKDEVRTYRHQGAGIRNDAWRSNDNAGISLFYSSGVGFTKDRLSVTFYSPSFMAAADKKLAENAAKKTRQSK